MGCRERSCRLMLDNRRSSVEQFKYFEDRGSGQETAEKNVGLEPSSDRLDGCGGGVECSFGFLVFAKSRQQLAEGEASHPHFPGCCEVLCQFDRRLQHGRAFFESASCRQNLALQALRSRLVLARVSTASKLERFGGEPPRILMPPSNQRQGAARVEQRDVPPPPGEVVPFQQLPCTQEELFGVAVIRALQMQSCLVVRGDAGLNHLCKFAGDGVYRLHALLRATQN
jgi:hypothetical protein